MKVFHVLFVYIIHHFHLRVSLRFWWGCFVVIIYRLWRRLQYYCTAIVRKIAKWKIRASWNLLKWPFLDSYFLIFCRYRFFESISYIFTYRTFMIYLGSIVSRNFYFLDYIWISDQLSTFLLRAQFINLWLWLIIWQNHWTI